MNLMSNMAANQVSLGNSSGVLSHAHKYQSLKHNIGEEKLSVADINQRQNCLYGKRGKTHTDEGIGKKLRHRKGQDLESMEQFSSAEFEDGEDECQGRNLAEILGQNSNILKVILF